MNRPLCAALASMALAGCAGLPAADDLQRAEHHVSLTSTAPSMQGQTVRLYLREIAPSGAGRRPVVLFVHGAGTPAEVSFDSKMADYSWMAQVARAGFDVFSVSLTGYGGSTRPAPMANPCNLAKAQQPGYVAAPCEPDRRLPLTKMASDWDDIAAVVDHLRQLRGVDKVSLVGWSQGSAPPMTSDENSKGCDLSKAIEAIRQRRKGAVVRDIVPALAKPLDEGIARGEGQLDVAAGVKVPTVR